MIDFETIKNNYERIRKNIKKVCDKSGRQVEDIRVMAVTKTFPVEYVEMAIKAGFTLFGENRVNEAFEKYIQLSEPVELHLIGHLQRNKVKTASRIFHTVQSIDKYETAEALNKRCDEMGRIIDILFEINTSGEESKFGFRDEAQYFSVLEKVMGLKKLRIRGLMTVGPLTEDKQQIREAFRNLRKLFEETKERYPELDFDILSMGMSGDYEIAVEEGSNLLRIGTAIFGKRS